MCLYINISCLIFSQCNSGLKKRLSFQLHFDDFLKILKVHYHINHTNIFLGQFPKAIEIKTKTKKCSLIKLTSFYTAKETINKTKILLTGRKYVQMM